MKAGMARWRLVLGRFSGDRLEGRLDRRSARMDAALDYLYGKEYEGRGVRARDPYWEFLTTEVCLSEEDRGRLDGIIAERGPGGYGESALSVPYWINEVRELFPRETVEVIERHALDRYGMTGLITDPEVLGSLTPSEDLLKAILTFKGWMNDETLTVARGIVAQVVEDIKRRLESEMRSALWGRRRRVGRTRMKVAANLDWRRTIRRNLKHYDAECGRLLVEDVSFFRNVENRVPWRVVLCVDQSGSMASSVIHSAVMAGILAALPSMEVSLVAFDTSVVDLSKYADDPVEVLMSVQLGGGTDIGKALEYCEGLLTDPHRTVVVLVSDLYEGGSVSRLFGVVNRLREAGVTILALGSLDEEAKGAYDAHMAEELAVKGVEVAVLTPRRLAEWLVKRIS